MEYVIAVIVLAVIVRCLVVIDRPLPPLEFPSGVYQYKYQRHPFDGWQYFTVEAPDCDTAELMAAAHFTTLFNDGVTVMVEFYPCYPKGTR